MADKYGDFANNGQQKTVDFIVPSQWGRRDKPSSKIVGDLVTPSRIPVA
jgi:hypothetical protein